MRLRNLIPTSTKLNLFKAAILPYLTYCHLVWHFCRPNDRRKLERTKERHSIAIYRDKMSSHHRLLDIADLCTLQNRRLQDLAILTTCTRLRTKYAPSISLAYFEYPRRNTPREIMNILPLDLIHNNIWEAHYQIYWD